MAFSPALKRLAAAFFILRVVWGCVAQPSPGVSVPPAALAGLKPGLTLERVQQVLNSKGDHQFTALLSSNTVRCFSYNRNDVYGKYYLLFTNNILSVICMPPEYEGRKVRYQDSWLNEYVLGDPETRISKTLTATNLFGPALAAALKPQTPPKHSSDLGLTAAFLLSQLGADKARLDQRRKQYLALLDKLDPTKVQLGLTVGEVEARLGKPQIVESLKSGDEKRYYGSVDFGLDVSREKMWLAIDYREGKVIRVFTDDFVDHQKIKQLEERFVPQRW